MSLLLALPAIPILLAIGSAGGAAPEPAEPVALRAGPAAAPRVVVLGFDGADGRTIARLAEEEPERYPTFARLAREGTLAPLGTVAPPESPVSWAALNTGRNPAQTGVPGFVKRSLEGGIVVPDLGFQTRETRPVESFRGTPIPTWSPGVVAAAAGGAVFLGFLLVFAVLLKMRLSVAGGLSLVLGALGAWGGWSVREMLPREVERVANPNRARNVWDAAAEAGVRSVVLDAAQAWDMEPAPGARVLANLGLPDARGDLGEWCIYTTSELEFAEPPRGRRTQTAGTIFRVHERDGEIRSRLHGPKNRWAIERVERRLRSVQEDLEDPSLDYDSSRKLYDREASLEQELSELSAEPISVELVLRRDGDSMAVRIDGQEQRLRPGEWSDFYRLSFPMNWLLAVHAVTRVKLVQVEPHVELFVDALHIDPERPPFWQPVSLPREFSAELAARCGTFETYGWPTLTMPYKDGVVSPELLMEDVEFTMKWRERLTYDSLGRDDWRFLMSVFSTPDRVQHMMYKFYDEEHPLHDPAEAEKEFEFFGETIRRKDAIPAIYRQMDRVVGTVLDEHLGPDDVLLVVSDHGFESFRRQVALNNWLAREGYLALRAGLSMSAGAALSFVDWKRTRAYSLGFGFVYLNLEGREPNGIVSPDDAGELLERIRRDLLAAEDEATGERFCEEVYVTAEIHEGPYLDLESDLMVGFVPGYRISWSSTSGGMDLVQDEDGKWGPGPVCYDNDSNWSGDHVSVALPRVAGVLLSNRLLDVPEGGANLLQVAPTVLALLGVAVPQEMDAPPLGARTAIQ